MTLSDQITAIPVATANAQLEQFVDGLAEQGRVDLVDKLQPALELMASAQAELDYVRELI